MKTIKLDPDQKPTKEQIEEIRAAAEKPITYDEDSPYLTENQLSRFRRVIIHASAEPNDKTEDI